MVLPPPIERGSAEAIFRYQVVAHVAASVRSGEKLLEAVRGAAGRNWLTIEGGLRRVGKRTIYRWLKAYEAGGLAALEPKPRECAAGPVVLPAELMQFVAEQKNLDVAASIPELIRRARELGIIAPTLPSIAARV